MNILRVDQVEALQRSLSGKPLAVCFGAGVDSTAMLVALHEAGLRPDVITFGDTKSEKKSAYKHIERMQSVLSSWRWPAIDVCQLKTLPTTGYDSLEGNCLANETLPSLAFGKKSCSLKWKTQAQDNFIKGVRRGPNEQPPHPLWLHALANRERIVKLIGYDNGRADRKRAAAIRAVDKDFDFFYPLQLIEWSRSDCVDAITRALGAHMVPVKSACFFCPASKEWELWWLAATDPDQFERALALERRALTGRHSRFDTVEFGATWEDLVRNAERFPSSSTTVGLGRSFAWNHWARINDVVDADFRVRQGDRPRFLAMADRLRSSTDNAYDGRSCAGSNPAAKGSPVRFVRQAERAFA